MTSPETRICVILGAGASKAVAGLGSVNRTAPPLGLDLFDIANNPNFSTILGRYPGAQFLAQELAELIASGVIGVEKALRHYRYHESPILREHFKHIPPYLRDLIWLTTNDHRAAPSNFNRLIANLLEEIPHVVLFLVLNYDLLVESAIGHLESNPNPFMSLPDYIADDRRKVVKLHGSIDWMRLLTREGQESWNDAVARDDVLGGVTEEMIKVLPVIGGDLRNPPRDVPDSFCYPVITTPMSDKSLGEVVCPTSHIAAAKDFLKECKKFLIVGTSGLDGDLMELMRDSIPGDAVLSVQFVGVDRKEIDGTLRNFLTGVPAFAGETSTCETYHDGFRSYLGSSGFITFLHS